MTADSWPLAPAALAMEPAPIPLNPPKRAALASGDTVVLKPPEWAPLTASYFAQLAHEAGLPAGVFNVVQGFGIEAGAPLTENPDVSRICFTGSVPTAKVVARAAAENLIPCSFELGGKSPTVILDDADLDLAVELAIEQYDNAGQVCLAGTESCRSHTSHFHWYSECSPGLHRA